MPLENQLNRNQSTTRERTAPDVENDPLLQDVQRGSKSGYQSPGNSGNFRTVVIAGSLLLALWGVNKGREMIFADRSNDNPVTEIVDGISDGFNESRYDSDLLKSMGERMKEMGYGDLTAEQLSDLRDKNLTATWIGQIRNLGYNDLTLDDAVRLKDRDVSPTFISMMQGLGYTLTVDDIVRLKDAEVKAQYTSQLADLGYKLSIDELIRLKSAGVSVDLVEKLVKQSKGAKPTLEDIIRYRASNQ